MRRTCNYSVICIYILVHNIHMQNYMSSAINCQGLHSINICCRILFLLNLHFCCNLYLLYWFEELLSYEHSWATCADVRRRRWGALYSSIDFLLIFPPSNGAAVPNRCLFYYCFGTHTHTRPLYALSYICKCVCMYVWNYIFACVIFVVNSICHFPPAFA